MKHKRRDESSEESTDDEIIVQRPPPVIDIGDDKEEEDDDIFELSQDVTQLVPRARYSEISPRKERKKEERRSKSASREIGRYTNGFRVREVNISEIPEHILTGLRIVNPQGVRNVGGLLTSEWETDTQEGAWVLKCPKDVNAAELLTGKKISLDNTTTLLSNDDDLELTQLVPNKNNVRGHSVQERLFEAISVSNQTLKESVMLLLPNDNTFKIVSAPVLGHIIVRESLKELDVPQIEIPRPKRRKLPKGIKERHPVYGADFTEIIEKMEAAPSPKKKKKKSRESVAVMEHPPVNGFSSQSNYYIDVSHIKQEIESDSSQSQKKKKKKRKRDEDETDTSYTDHQERNNVIVDFSTPYEDTLESPRKKKSKKRKRDGSVDLDTSEHLLATNEIHEPPVKKLKKRKSEYRN